MAEQIEHKRVEFTELFYDLVFVYAISKTTSLIHHLHHGVIDIESLATFLVVLVVMVNTWMIQTVFTNRYGKNSLFNMSIMFINMAILLLTSNMITSDWQSYFGLFCLTVGTLSLTLFFQYLVEYLKQKSTYTHKQVLRGFLSMTGLRTITSYGASLLSLENGSIVFLIGIVTSMFMPLFFQEKQARVPVNLPHLIERVSLLVIITFGEMVMGIADFFTPEKFSPNSALYFLIMAFLFLYYFGEFDHAINEKAHTQGIHLIYSHYPIFIGLLMVTVSFTFMAEPEANTTFVVGFLYIGLAFFQWATISNSKHNKDYLLFDAKYLTIQAALLIMGFVVSLLLQENMNFVLYVTTATVFAFVAHFSWFYIVKSKAKGLTDWNLI